jgi:aspartyl-tRNA(Asn)/glutamyl-tRNA(Gln) amidotransferase subunit C
MAVKKETVRKVAELARIELTEREVEKFSRDLGEVIDAFGKLQRIPTKGVRPTFQPVEQKNVMREDRIEESIPRELLLKNLRNKQSGFIKGPRVV